MMKMRKCKINLKIYNYKDALDVNCYTSSGAGYIFLLLTYITKVEQALSLVKVKSIEIMVY